MMSLLSAFSFIQPWAWYGLAALTIPILIHLLSKSRGRLVQWGTTRFLPQAKPIKMTQLKLTQRLLLLLRCLIILFSLAILAKLYISDSSRTDETVVLVNKTWFSNATEQTRLQLARYIESADHQVVWLDDFESLTKEDVIKFTSKKNESSHNTSPLNNWAQLSLAETNFINAKQFIVFSSAHTLQFIGEKPLITRPIKWFINTDTKRDNLNALIRAPFNVVIFADDGHQTALDYLLPALNVIKQFNVNQLTIEVITDPQNFSLIKRPNWLFYLTNKPITEQLNEWLALGTHIFIDGSNNSSIISQHSMVSNGYGLLKPVNIYQYSELLSVETAKKEQQKLWAINKNLENKGQISNELTSKKLIIKNKTDKIIPMLTVSKNKALNIKTGRKSSGSLFRYSGLLSPQWSDLVTQAQFPLVLQTLLFGELITSQQQVNNQISADNLNQFTTLLYKQALVIQQQNENNESLDKKISSQNAEVNESYHQKILAWLGLVLIILFILERLLSEYSIHTPLVVSQDD